MLVLIDRIACSVGIRETRLLFFWIVVVTGDFRLWLRNIQRAISCWLIRICLKRNKGGLREDERVWLLCTILPRRGCKMTT